MYRLLILLLLCAPVLATEITLTQSQVDTVLDANPQECPPVEECPPVDPPEPPIPPEPPEECSDIAGGARSGWSNVFMQSFPGPSFMTRTNIIMNGDYFAVEFFTGNAIGNGKISSPQNASTPRMRVGAISECLGNFDVPAECKHTWGEAGGIKWVTDDEVGCRLKPNTKYYFNIKFPSCEFSTCRFNLRHVNV